MLVQSTVTFYCLVYVKRKQSTAYEFSHMCSRQAFAKVFPKNLQVGTLLSYRQHCNLKKLMQQVSLFLFSFLFPSLF